MKNSSGRDPERELKNIQQRFRAVRNRHERITLFRQMSEKGKRIIMMILGCLVILLAAWKALSWLFLP